MTTPFIIVKSPKSVGIAILLTLLFGPIGLFYASVTGGIVLTFVVPACVGAFWYLGIANHDYDTVRVAAAITLLLFLFYWLICIVWAVISVKQYNAELEQEYQRQVLTQQALNQHTLQPAPGVQELTQSNSHFQQWRKMNPQKDINEYYREFGV